MKFSRIPQERISSTLCTYLGPLTSSNGERELLHKVRGSLYSQLKQDSTLAEIKFPKKVWSICKVNDALFAGGDNTVYLLTRNSVSGEYEIKRSLPALHGRYGIVAIETSTGHRLAAGATDGSIVILDGDKDAVFKEVDRFRGHKNDTKTVINDSRNRLYTGGGDKTIKIWKEDEIGKYREVELLKGHKSAVLTLAIHNDSGVLISGSRDKTIRIWRLDQEGKFKLAQILEGHKNNVNDVCINNEGNLMFSGAGDNTVKVWKFDGSNFKIEDTLNGHKNFVLAVRISNNSKTLFSGSTDNTIIVWRVKEGTTVFTKSQILESHSNSIRTLCISKYPALLFSGSDDRTIRIWAFKEKWHHQLSKVIGGHLKPVNATQLSSDMKLLVSGSDDSSMKIWMFDEKKGIYNQTQEIKNHTQSINDLKISEDSTIFSCSTDKTIRVYKIGKKGQYYEYQMLRDDSNQVTFDYYNNQDPYVEAESVNLGDSHSVQAAKDDQPLGSFTELPKNKIIDAIPEVEEYTEQDNKVIDTIEQLNLKQETQALPKIEEESHSDVIDKQQSIETKPNAASNQFGIPLPPLPSPIDIILKDSADKSPVFNSTKQGAGNDRVEVKRGLTIDKLGESKPIIKNEVHSSIDNGYANNEKSLSASKKRESITMPKPITTTKNTLRSHSDKISMIGLSIDGTCVFSCSNDEKIKVWKLRANGKYEIFQTLDGHNNVVNSVITSLDSQVLFSGSSDKTIKVWMKGATAEYKKYQTLDGHSLAVSTLCVSRDLNVLFSGSSDLSIKVWRLREDGLYQENQTLEGHKSYIKDLCLSSDATTLYSGSLDGNVNIWRLNSKQQYSLEYTYAIKSEVHSLTISKNSTQIMIGTNQDIHILRLGGAFFLFNSPDGEYLTLLTNILHANFSVISVRRFQFKIQSDFQDLSDFSDRLKLHVCLNPLYFVALAGIPEILSEMLVKYHYDPIFYENEDTINYDPFHLSLVLKNMEILDVWAEYFEKNIDMLKSNVSKLYEPILKSKSDYLKQIYLKRLLGPTAPLGIRLPRLGNLRNSSDYLRHISKKALLDELDLKKITESQISLYNQVEVVFFSTNMPVDLGLSSNFTTLLLDSLVEADSETQLSNVKFLARMIFNQKKYLFWIYSFINWVGVVNLLLIVIWGTDHIVAIVLYLISFCLGIIYEIVNLLSSPRRYIKDYYNLYDIFMYPAGLFLVLYSLYSDREYLAKEHWNFITSISIAIILIRSISMLRVVDGIRYMTTMTLAVFFDMRYFLVLMVLFIASISSLKILSSVSSPEFQGNGDEFWRTMDDIFNWGFGNWEGTADFAWNLYVLYIISSIFIALALMNMLIAIISMTFEKFTDERELVDLQQMLNMLADMNAFIRFFRMIRKKKYDSKNYYYHFMIMHKENPATELTETKKMVETATKFMIEHLSTVDKRLALIEAETEKNKDMKSELLKIEQRIIGKLIAIEEKLSGKK